MPKRQSKLKTHSAILQFCRIKTQTQQRKKKKKDEIGGSRKLGIGPALTVGVERKNERGREQELREKSIARMRKRR